MRVTLTGILTHQYGEAAATGFIHEFQGVITFAVAFFALLLEAGGLTWIRKNTRSWLQTRSTT